MSASLTRLGRGLLGLLRGEDRLSLVVGAAGPQGGISVPSGHDGVWETTEVQGRPCLRPTESSYYLYFALPRAFRERARGAVLFVEVEYFGERFGEFRLQYASLRRESEWQGLYQAAEQRWQPDAVGLRRFRRALFSLPDFDPDRMQHLGASFRLEFRRELLVSRVVVGLEPPAEPFPALAPVPELRKMPGRFYPIDYVFIEITNACNFKCSWCPDAVMGRRRGFMKKERAFRIIDELAEKRGWLGPLFPVKLHEMGEPMLHPDLALIVAYAEGKGLPIELNTNCGLITQDAVDALYSAGLTNLILSYQTPDAPSFTTRKAPRLTFEEYRDKVRLAVERKVATGARTVIEIDIMNTKHVDGYRIVSEDEQAIAFLSDWIDYARELERRYGLAARDHDLAQVRERHVLDQDENGSRYTILDGVHLVWKRCHSWGNAIGGTPQQPADGRPADGRPADGRPVDGDTYCPAPHDQLVIQWNGDVVSCCTDYEGLTKMANVFTSSVEEVWRDGIRQRRLREMLEGRLLDVCARCQGVKS